MAQAPDDEDYLIPLFEQAITALSGASPDASETYETSVTTAERLSQRLAAPAIAVWGSDEWPGLAGAAFFEKGATERAYSVFDREEVRHCMRAREAWPEDYGDFPGFNDEGREEMSFELVAERGVERIRANSSGSWTVTSKTCELSCRTSLWATGRTPRLSTHRGSMRSGTS